MTGLDIIDKAWPFAASVVVSAVAFGSLNSDVHNLKDEQAMAHSDHDAVTRIEQRQQDMQDTLKDIQKSLKHLDAR